MSLSWRKHEILKPPADEVLAAMRPDEVAALYCAYHEAIENAERDPFRYGWKLSHWRDAEGLLSEFNEVLVSGGNRCLAGEQEIYDPVKKKATRVDCITDDFHVEAWDEKNQRFVTAVAKRPFQKPAQALIRFELANGQTLSCSESHLVLTPLGWREAASLVAGSYICGSLDNHEELRKRESLKCRLGSTLDTCQQVFQQDGWRSSQTIQDSQSCCLNDHCSCDEQLQSEAGSAQEIAPSQVDAPECISLCGNILHSISVCDTRLVSDTQDDLVPKRGYTHFYPLSVLPSIRDALLQRGDQFSDTLSRASCTPCKSASPLCEGQPRETACQQSSAESSHLQSWREFPQPDIQYSQFSYFGEDSVAWIKVVKHYFLRTDAVWDFEVPEYKNYVAAGVISHNSSKTTWAASAVVKAAIENPGAVIMCFAQNADVSIRQQQSAIYDALPEEMRKKTLGAEENVSYTRKNGFSKSSLILPGSRTHIIFKTYSQFLNNDTILEGAELGSREPKWINIGAWCDEYLIGPELLATLRFRLATRNAKLIVTFTPIDGYTEVVRDYLAGANTIRSKEAELLNGRSVPYIQHSKNRNAGIIYFHSKDNPFGGYERIASDLKGRPEDEILTRAYGVPTKSISTLFPLFSRETNVVAHEKIPTKDVTRYMVLDPAGRKNWFMCWIAVDATDTYWVYREWPGVNVGDWAKWHGGKWIGGEGSKGLGYGIKDYVDLILRSEENENIFERLIDPRLGAAKYQTQDGASSIIEDLADAGLIFIPAPGLEIEDGLQALQTKMAYDKKKPIDGLNRPHFYISDRCQNIITALQEYTGKDGPDEAWKDPIDVIRYAAIAGARYIDPSKMKSTKPKGGY